MRGRDFEGPGAKLPVHRGVGHDRDLFAHQREDFHHVGDAFYRPEIRKVHQDGLIVLGPLFARRLVRAAHVLIAIHEIRNHFDRTLDLEFANGVLAQVVRNGGDAIALLD